MLGQARRLTPHEGGPSAVIDALVACMSEAAAAAQLDVAQLDGIGVGVPGEVDAAAGTLARAGNLPEWEQPVPLAALLSERLGPEREAGQRRVGGRQRRAVARRRSRTRNRCWACSGERASAAAWRSTASCGTVAATPGRSATWSSSRGARAARAGGAAAWRPMRGAARWKPRQSGWSRKATTPTCSRSCASANAKRSQAAYGRTRCKHEDKLAQRLIERAVKALGSGIASAVNLLDVELVLLGGGLGQPLRRADARAHRWRR